MESFISLIVLARGETLPARASCEWLIGRRGPSPDCHYHNHALFRQEVVKDSVVAHAPAPPSRLVLQATDVAGKGVLAHDGKSGFNLLSILWGKAVEILLRGLCYDQVPRHGEVRRGLRIRHAQMRHAHA